MSDKRIGQEPMDDGKGAINEQGLIDWLTTWQGTENWVIWPDDFDPKATVEAMRNVIDAVCDPDDDDNSKLDAALARLRRE